MPLLLQLNTETRLRCSAFLLCFLREPDCLIHLPSQLSCISFGVVIATRPEEMVNWLRLLGQDRVVGFVCERVVHHHLAVVALLVVCAMVYIRAAVVNPSRLRALR